MVETTEFQEHVYKKLKKVPRGKITTYGDLAKACMTSARAIGSAMRCNPYAPKVPCHRVVTSDGKIGGFAGKRRGKKILEKIDLLKKEGIKINVTERKIIDFEKVCHRWKEY